MDRFSRAEVETLLTGGVARGAFPGAVAMWGDPARPVPEPILSGLRGRSRNAVAVMADLSYDLASLTKLLASTGLALLFFQRGLLDLDEPLDSGPLARRLPAGRAPAADWSSITPARLLAHQSGLPPWRPLYRLGGQSLEDRKNRALEAIWAETPEAEPGRRSIYSDLNFILLGFLLEEIGGDGLDRLFQEHLATPLGLSATFRPLKGPLAPTEDGFRYGGPVGHPQALWRGPVPLGQVHDDNAAWLGGVAGHAGLFAAAADVWALAAQWAEAWREGRSRLFSGQALKIFTKPRPTLEDQGRSLGFNIKREVAALKGSRLSGSAVGHLGYTGVSLWWEPEESFVWLFLSNRVHLKAWNPAWVPADFVGGPSPTLSKNDWTSGP